MQQIINPRHRLQLPSILADCLPITLIHAVQQCGASRLEELRLHCGRYATVSDGDRNFRTEIILNESEMADILKKMCCGSLYAFSNSINQGYLCMKGGIRIGICGSAALENDSVIGVNDVTGLIVRIPHRIPVPAEPIMARFRARQETRGILIYAPPGIGKTTLLRAFSILAASPAYSYRTVVVDTREEFAFTLDGKDLNLDILVGYPKDIGITIAVRNLGAQLIVCDEIGNAADARAILSAANCGVPLIASAHAATLEELLSRPSFQQLHKAHVFGLYVGIRRNGNGGFSYIFTDHNDLCSYKDESRLKEIL